MYSMLVSLEIINNIIFNNKVRNNLKKVNIFWKHLYNKARKVAIKNEETLKRSVTVISDKTINAINYIKA